MTNVLEIHDATKHCHCQRGTDRQGSAAKKELGRSRYLLILKSLHHESSEGDPSTLRIMTIAKSHQQLFIPEYLLLFPLTAVR